MLDSFSHCLDGSFLGIIHIIKSVGVEGGTLFFQCRAPYPDGELAVN